MTASLNKLKTIAGSVNTSGVNWKAILLWGVLFGVGLFALWYYKVEPVYSWMCTVGSWADSTIASLTGDLNLENVGAKVTEYITANPVVAVTGVIGVAGGALALYERSQRIRETNLKLAAQEAEEYAKIQSSAVTDNLAYYKQQAESATAELTSLKETNTAQLYEAAKTELSTKATEVQALQKQVEELMDKLANTPVKVVEVYK